MSARTRFQKKMREFIDEAQPHFKGTHAPADIRLDDGRVLAYCFVCWQKSPPRERMHEAWVDLHNLPCTLLEEEE